MQQKLHPKWPMVEQTVSLLAALQPFNRVQHDESGPFRMEHPVNTNRITSNIQMTGFLNQLTDSEELMCLSTLEDAAEMPPTARLRQMRQKCRQPLADRKTPTPCRKGHSRNCWP
jgi:hypothetical protein